MSPIHQLLGNNNKMWGGGATGGKIPVSMLAESGGIQSAGALAGGHLSLSLYLSLWKILSEGSLLSFFLAKDYVADLVHHKLYSDLFIATCSWSRAIWGGCLFLEV